MPLLVDPNGHLFGVTQQGSPTNVGVAFELRQKNHAWIQTTIYSFCASGVCDDEAFPSGPFLQDAAGNLYAVTGSGGNQTQGGVLYELSPQKSGWKQTILHTFCSETDCLDGNTPVWSLASADSGSLLGVTALGGKNDSDKGGDGTIYEMKDSLTVIYNFCSRANCVDGSAPQGGVTEDSSGYILGTTYTGGSNDHGAVFEFTP